jgi:hypothetical protein
LCYREKGGPEDDVADGPSVFQRTEDQDQLRDDIDDYANHRPENVDDPKSERFGIIESYEALEGRDGNEKRDPKDSEATDP